LNSKHIPLQEILFAAKTGFLSKSLWLEYFTSRSPSRNSRVWNRLLKDGYFKKHDSKMLPSVLVLGSKSNEELEKLGIKAVTKPHLSQFDHDEKTARIALSLQRQGLLKCFTTEAELKRRHWVWLKTTKAGAEAKFPDLTIELPDGAKLRTVAIEIEQSKKNFERYKKVMNSYANSKTVDLVIFVSNQQVIFNCLSRAMKEVNYPTWERPVGFGEMDAWLQGPGSAAIYLSRSATSIRELVDQSTSNTGSNSVAS
jgi:hypothetical protein